jgi:threonine/homoserine/homoserine lactone efflux protein
MIDQLLNTCTDIVSCFQTIYNLLFALLFFLSFLWFLYGAIEYLLSAGSITSKEEGKKRMINSIVAVLIAFLIPVILNMINPKIFNFQLKIPDS